MGYVVCRTRGLEPYGSTEDFFSFSENKNKNSESPLDFSKEGLNIPHTSKPPAGPPASERRQAVIKLPVSLAQSPLHHVCDNGSVASAVVRLRFASIMCAARHCSIRHSMALLAAAARRQRRLFSPRTPMLRSPLLESNRAPQNFLMRGARSRSRLPSKPLALRVAARSRRVHSLLSPDPDALLSRHRSATQTVVPVLRKENTSGAA